jgi:hypothetical protein
MAGLETIVGLYDLQTNTSYAVSKLEQKLTMPRSRRTAGFAAMDSSGVFDPRVSVADPLKDVLVDLYFEVTYGGASDAYATYTAAWDAFVRTCCHGRPLTITFDEGDGTTRYGSGKVVDWDKAMILGNIGWIAVSCKIWMPNPILEDQYKGGIARIDTGRFLDAGNFLDVDPDNFALTAANTTHTTTNGGTYADEAPVIRLIGGSGGITGPIYVYNNSIPMPSGLSLFFGYLGSVAANETVTVDTGAFDVTSNSGAVDAFGFFYLPAGQAEWFRIETGVNNIAVGCTAVGTGARCGIDWKPRYL